MGRLSQEGLGSHSVGWAHQVLLEPAVCGTRCLWGLTLTTRSYSDTPSALSALQHLDPTSRAWRGSCRPRGLCALVLSGAGQRWSGIFGRLG